MTKDACLLSTSLLNRMAHDIRGPVGVVGFLLEDLATGESTPEQLAELLARSRRSLQRLLQVADRLTRAALLASDDLELSFSRLELRVLLRDCVAVAVDAESRAEVELRLALGEQPIFTDMDARWLSAALSDTVMTFIRRARSVVEITIGGPVDEPLRVTLSHDGRRTQNEPDLCADLPIAMLAATARRHGWNIDVSPCEPSTDGLLQGGQIVLQIGASRQSASAPPGQSADNVAELRVARRLLYPVGEGTTMANERIELRGRVERRMKQLTEALKQAEIEELPDDHLGALRSELSRVEASLSGGWSSVSDVTAQQLSSWLEGTRHLIDNDPGGTRDTVRTTRIADLP